VALGLLLTLAGAPFAAAALYLLVLATASFRRLPAAAAAPALRLAVLVPAHDEEALVGRCVRSLVAQRYPRACLRVVVIADNCGDGTAAAALEAGAEVLERRDEEARGKGHALRWAMDRLLAEPFPPPLAGGGAPAGAEGGPPDGIAVVDADSIADPDLIAHLAAALAGGADAAQAEYLILTDDASTRSRLVSAAFLLFHRVRLGGRAALGMPVNLVGNGMLFSRRLLETLPWNAFTGVEDLEYSLNLRLAGFRPRFVGSARVLGPVPHGYRGMRGQRMRWEGGRWHVVRHRLPGLVAHGLRRDPGVLDAALDLAVPPLGLLAMGLGAGLTLTAGAVALHLAPAWSLSPWLLAAAGLAGFVCLGLRSAGAPASTWLALLESPRFLLWKALTYARIAAGFDARRWERAERSGPAAGVETGRVEIGGVPIDRVDMGGALDRIGRALDGGERLQVATVNLDFLVRAQRHPELRAVLARSELNVADGAPVVWVSRLVGRPVPTRVAGADLVPLVVEAAARRGASVFLLGGEGGAAADAARRLVRDHPELAVAGWYEPPRAGLDEMDGDAIVAMIERSGARVLLVALGNPKQELWIARHRERLTPVSVAIGVGCVFDLWAGRARRAPRWMQRSGLEWLHRLLSEPRRLAGRYATDATWLVVLAGRAVLQRARATL
jgi:1,2-diacylglycerol 3-beta-glucosyltransferase